MDDAEIARLREIAQKELPFERASEMADKANGWGYRVAFKPSVALALLDALEQAQTTIVRWRDRFNESVNMGVECQAQRNAAQQSAKDARALIAECDALIAECDALIESATRGRAAKKYRIMHARIEAFLEPKI